MPPRCSAGPIGPIFIDKLPNNWAHLPLIHLILPNATIIDARRHPLGCCFSNFKQHFARGPGVQLRAGRHGALLPRLCPADGACRYGAARRASTACSTRIWSTIPKRQVRARCSPPAGWRSSLLASSFHETDRAVRTASSEQVRQPIFRDGTDAWKPFERWLDPLKDRARRCAGPRIRMFRPSDVTWPICHATACEVTKFGDSPIDVYCAAQHDCDRNGA